MCRGVLWGTTRRGAREGGEGALGSREREERRKERERERRGGEGDLGSRLSRCPIYAVPDWGLISTRKYRGEMREGLRREAQ